MDAHILQLLAGGLLILAVTLGSSWITRLPFSYALIYLIVGILLGPNVTGLFDFRLDAQSLEYLTEIVVIISVFGCGLKMNRGLRLSAWNTTDNFAFILWLLYFIN